MQKRYLLLGSWSCAVCGEINNPASINLEFEIPSQKKGFSLERLIHTYRMILQKAQPPSFVNARHNVDRLYMLTMAVAASSDPMALQKHRSGLSRVIQTIVLVAGIVSLQSVLTVHKLALRVVPGPAWMPALTREATTSTTRERRATRISSIEGGLHNSDDRKKQSVLPVFLWPNVNQSNFDDNTLGYSTWWQEFKHFTIEGVENSSYLHRIYDTADFANHPNLLWIVDTNQGKRPSVWCETLELAIEQAQQQQPPTAQRQWPIYVMDWSDDTDLPWQYQHCEALYEMMGSHNVHYLKRSYVVHRHWDNATCSISLGQVNPHWSRNYSYWSSTPVRHINYGVRTDIVRVIGSILESEYAHVNATESSSVLLPRPKDVIHFWPAPSQQAEEDVVSRKGVLGDNNSQLRDGVSEALLELNRTHRNMTASAQLTGTAANGGRLQAQSDYARALLEYKIVVVAQKDHWEDHYRLMEALVGGALVMTDRMLMLPEGLEDGKSIVIYDNVTDLIQKVQYYLWHVDKDARESIAREGRRVAMTLHRSWHLMERVVFGRVLSDGGPVETTEL